MGPRELRLVELNALVGVPLGHVGQDHPVAGLEAAEDLDGVDGAAAELDLGADGLGGGEIAAVGLEEVDGAALLAEGRAADVDDVVETLEFDGAVDREVRAGALRQRAGEENVDGDRAILDGGVDAADGAGAEAVAGVDGGD